MATDAANIADVATSRDVTTTTKSTTFTPVIPFTVYAFTDSATDSPAAHRLSHPYLTDTTKSATIAAYTASRRTARAAYRHC